MPEAADIGGVATRFLVIVVALDADHRIAPHLGGALLQRDGGAEKGALAGDFIGAPNAVRFLVGFPFAKRL